MNFKFPTFISSLKLTSLVILIILVLGEIVNTFYFSNNTYFLFIATIFSILDVIFMRYSFSLEEDIYQIWSCISLIELEKGNDKDIKNIYISNLSKRQQKLYNKYYKNLYDSID